MYSKITNNIEGVILLARRNMIEKLIKKEDINEEIKLIKNSLTDYISPNGNVYKDYGNNLYYPKKNFINKNTCFSSS